MPIFKGQFKYSVDPKGRLALPAKLRKCITIPPGETLTLARGFDGCIYIYPPDEWKKIEDNFNKLPASSEQARYLERAFMPWLSDTGLDKQSRITITDDLLKYARIENEVLILGMRNRIELWNPAVYEEYLNKRNQSYEAVAEQVMLPIEQQSRMQP